jgi:hypothetical protein
MTDRDEDQAVGLCASCRQVRRLRSERGSVFYFCRLSEVDPRFPKYPALPIRSCSGYEEQSGATEPGSRSS